MSSGPGSCSVIKYLMPSARSIWRTVEPSPRRKKGSLPSRSSQDHASSSLYSPAPNDENPLSVSASLVRRRGSGRKGSSTRVRSRPVRSLSAMTARAMRWFMYARSIRPVSPVDPQLSVEAQNSSGAATFPTAVLQTSSESRPHGHSSTSPPIPGSRGEPTPCHS